MPTTEAQKRATAKWQTERVEEIKFRVPKGQKAIIQEHAAQQGESVNAFMTPFMKTFSFCCFKLKTKTRSCFSSLATVVSVVEISVDLTT